MYDVIVIGGGPAGLTAALYSLRFGKSVLLIEKESFGGQMTFSPKIENYPAFTEISGLELADKMSEQVIEKGAVIELAEVERIVPGKPYKVVTEYGDYEGKTVIIATGVRHRMLGLEHEEEYIGNGIYFCALCDGGLFKDREVILVGGGNSALQEATLLSDICSKVTVIQNLADFTGEKTLSDCLKRKPNVECIFNTVSEKLIIEDGIKGLSVRNTETNEVRDIYAPAVFVAIGLIPDNKKFADLVPTDKNGYFAVDETLVTPSGGIFVAGDCRAKRNRQIVTAASDGASAAISASAYIDTNY